MYFFTRSILAVAADLEHPTVGSAGEGRCDLRCEDLEAAQIFGRDLKGVTPASMNGRRLATASWGVGP